MNQTVFGSVFLNNDTFPSEVCNEHGWGKRKEIIRYFEEHASELSLTEEDQKKIKEYINKSETEGGPREGSCGEGAHDWVEFKGKSVLEFIREKVLAKKSTSIGKLSVNSASEPFPALSEPNWGPIEQFVQKYPSNKDEKKVVVFKDLGAAGDGDCGYHALDTTETDRQTARNSGKASNIHNSL